MLRFVIVIATAGARLSKHRVRASQGTWRARVFPHPRDHPFITSHSGADTVDATLSAPATVRDLELSPETRVNDGDGWVLSQKGATKPAVDQLPGYDCDSGMAGRPLIRLGERACSNG